MRHGADEREEAEVSTDLVHRIHAGDREAEAKLFERYRRGLLYLLTRRTRDAHLAEDMLQESFRIVLVRLRKQGLAEPAKLAAFLRATALNLLTADYRKAARRQTETDEEAVSGARDQRESQLAQVLKDEAASTVRAVLEELPTPRDRELLFRFYVAEEPKEAICADLKLESLHFNRVLHRARQRFKERLLALLDTRTLPRAHPGGRSETFA